MRRSLLVCAFPLVSALAVLAGVAGLAGAPSAGAGDDPARALPTTFRDVFQQADVVEVVSIDPNVHRAWGNGREDADGRPLARWLTAVAEAEGVYGRVAVTDATVRAALLSGLSAGVAKPGPRAACYDPRHAIVARRGDVTVAAHLCFMCNTVVFLDAATAAGQPEAFGDPAGLLARLDGLLKAAKVTLARDVEAAAAKAGPKGAQLSAPLELFGLGEPETLEVYGLDPAVYAPFGYGHLKGEGTPYAQAMAMLAAGQGVRAKATVTRASAREALSDQLYAGYARGGDPAQCFLPRHALVMKAGAKEAVFFLCFECSYATAIGPKTEGGRNLPMFSDPGFLQTRLDLILSASAVPAAK